MHGTRRNPCEVCRLELGRRWLVPAAVAPVEFWAVLVLAERLRLCDALGLVKSDAAGGLVRLYGCDVIPTEVQEFIGSRAPKTYKNY